MCHGGTFTLCRRLRHLPAVDKCIPLPASAPVARHPSNVPCHHSMPFAEAQSAMAMPVQHRGRLLGPDWPGPSVCLAVPLCQARPRGPLSPGAVRASDHRLASRPPRKVGSCRKPGSDVSGSLKARRTAQEETQDPAPGSGPASRGKPVQAAVGQKPAQERG